MADPNFKDTRVIIATVDETGCLGFVFNKPFSRTINELEEFRHLKPFPLYEGGPVDQEHLYFIHRRSDVIPGGDSIAKDWTLGGDFKQALHYIDVGVLDETDIKIFIGYSGWDAGELVAEIDEGSWEKISKPENIFEV